MFSGNVYIYPLLDSLCSNQTAMILKRLFLLAILFCLTSCATIFNKKQYKLKIYSTTANVRAKVYDSVYRLPADVSVKRSKDDLKVTIITDSLSRELIVRPRLSPQFCWGNMGFLSLMPVGYLTDLTNSKRFYYGKELLLNVHDTISTIGKKRGGLKAYFKRRYPTAKGQFNLVLSVPYANLFYMQPHNERAKTLGGFLGASLGAEYYYKENKYAKFTAAASINFIAPVPAPASYDGPTEFASAYNFTLTDNYKLSRFTVGYGLNYGIYQWRLTNNEYLLTGEEEPRTRINHDIGIATNAYYQFSRSFFVGVIYNPTFISTYPKTEFNYQHVISLDFLWKIKL